MLILILFQGFTCSLLSWESGDLSGGDRGLLLGFGASKFVGSESSDQANRFIPGITLGFYQDFKINPRFVLETGLQLSSKGSKLDAVGDIYIHQIVTYLEVPVLAGWTLFPFEKVNIFLAGGPCFGVKLLAFNEVGFPEEIHRFDVGLDLGAGLKFQHISFRIELKRGFLNIDRSSTYINYKNFSLSLVAGISF